MASDHTLTLERLREVLDYDATTGIFRWKIVRPRVRIGDIAGNMQTDGYWRLCIDARQYKAHRVAWLYVYGVWPSVELDHRNEIKSDNRIANLREDLDDRNSQNQTRAHRNNRSGYLGVSPYKNRWRAGIRVDGRRHVIGTFDTPEAAHAAYVAAKATAHPFWRER